MSATQGEVKMQRRSFFKLGLMGMSALAVSESASALKYYPRTSDKKWAVLYASWCGSTRDAALWISEGMGGIADVFDVREKPDLRRFDHLIVGSAIRERKISPELLQYLDKCKSQLAPKVRGLFSVCGNMQRPVTPELVDSLIVRQLAPACGVEGVPAHVFLGRVTKILMEPGVRELMKNFPDYDNLKRPECMAFGNEILGRA